MVTPPYKNFHLFFLGNVIPYKTCFCDLAFSCVLVRMRKKCKFFMVATSFYYLLTNFREIPMIISREQSKLIFLHLF